MKIDSRYFKYSAIFLLSLFLLGCETMAQDGQSGAADESQAGGSTVAENNAAPIGSPLVSANDSLLAILRYSRFINGLSKEPLEKEFQRINDAYFLRPNDRSGLKRAMLLIMPGTSFYDLYQAKQAFSDILHSSDNTVPAFKEFADFMLSVIRSQEEATKQNAQLQEQLAQEVQVRKKIEEKLEALKTIEESMTQRRGQ
ncbi:hypothetical protein [Kaarinaea lacus]